MDSPDPASWTGGAPGRTNSRKDLVTGPIRGSCALQDLARISSVTQWMSRDPVTIGPDTTVAEALNQMLFGGFRHLPVMDQDAVVGMVSMRDLAKSIAKE
jgi:predicted transcriptional regulator